MSIRVVLVDDQEMYRTGFRMVLDTVEGIEVVGDAADGGAALDLLRTVRADVVLMDVRMPGMDGVEATRRLRANTHEPTPKVLVLTTFDLDEYAYDAIAAGASGFLLKDVPLEELVAAIGHVHDGEAVVAPSTTRRLLAEFTATRAASATQEEARRSDLLSDLTAREREVLLLIAEGFSNTEIATHLSISESTVRVHVSRILTKLELRDRVQAVVLAFRNGLVGT